MCVCALIVRVLLQLSATMSKDNFNPQVFFLLFLSVAANPTICAVMNLCNVELIVETK